MQKANNLQDEFLDQICRQKAIVTMYLIDRNRMQGVVTDYDASVVVLHSLDYDSRYGEQWTRNWVISRNSISAIELLTKETEEVTPKPFLENPEHHTAGEKEENVGYRAEWIK